MTDTSILTTLGAGSGIDTVKLVADLTTASRQPRQKVLDSRTALNTARLTDIAQLSSALTTLATGTTQRLRSLADADIPSFVEDLVSAINEIHGELAGATVVGTSASTSGALTSDSGARALGRALGSLAGSRVAGATTYSRLSDIGISTARDGTLVLDSARLNAAITADLPAVKALLGVGSALSAGFAVTLNTLRDTMTGTNGVLTLAKTGYTRVAKTIDVDKQRLDDDMTRLTDRLTASFSLMDQQVAAIKASQAYLTQQIAAWNKPA